MKMEDKYNSINTELQYKEHGKFFEDFFTYRRKAHELLTLSFADNSKVIPTYQAIYLLLSYTSNYVLNKDELKKRLHKIPSFIKNGKTYEAIIELDNILDNINENHEKTELIPKKKTEEKTQHRLWRKEEDLILREIKKGMADIIVKQ